MASLLGRDQDDQGFCQDWLYLSRISSLARVMKVSVGFNRPDEFIGRFGCPQDQGGHECGAMNVSVIDLRDPQDDVLPSRIAQTGAS